MNRDLPVSGQVTQKGDSDGNREEVPEVDLGGERPIWSRNQDIKNSRPAHSF